MKKLIAALFMLSASVFTFQASAAETREEAVKSYSEDVVNALKGKFTLDEASKNQLRKIASEGVEKMLSAASEPARNEWIAFQGTKECRELNDMINNQGVAKIDEIQVRVMKSIPLFTKETIENQNVKNAYQEMQKKLTSALLDGIAKNKPAVQVNK